jgi:hypothetical protein
MKKKILLNKILFMKSSQDHVCPENLYLHSSSPQMYMQALLGPARVGRQTPSVQVTLASKSKW